jgi:formylglycine-generating enzyme required for sulfatase activity/ribosomal protein L40E
MHCERCNVDFPDGLRYCKWCGEVLVDRPRITSELHSCPNCAAAIQPGWTFCKACGERLQTAAQKSVGTVCSACGAEIEPDATRCVKCGASLRPPKQPKDNADATHTTLIASCSSCGEQLDTGSLYCKGCGSAVYTEKQDQPRLGGSALLCGECKSYSPLGSKSCHVCGASLVQSASSVVEFPASGLTTIQQKPPTLPDLDDHVMHKQPATQVDESDLASGAHTLTFDQLEKPGDSQGKSPAETNMLPGTAGARSEQQSPTGPMKMGRTTGPVDSDEQTSQGAPSASGELASPPEPTTVAPGTEDKTKAISPFESTVMMASIASPPPSPPPQKGPSTLGLSSEAEADNSPTENNTAIFVSPRQAPQHSSGGLGNVDDIGTRPITPSDPVFIQPTQEIQHPRQVPADHVGASAQSVPQRPTNAVTTIPPAPPVVTSEPPAQKKTGVMVVSAVVVLILIGAAIYVGWLLLGRGKPSTPAAPPIAAEQPAAPPVAQPEKPPAPVVPEGMLAVTPGRYTIGRDGADPLEQPEHKVDLPAFYIDRSEVTNAAYLKFVEATGHKPPTNWNGSSIPAGHANFPVTGVTWQDATAYAQWAGKRLPTEAEWEAAARGADGRIYPWGNDWRAGAANIGQKSDKPSPEQYPAGLKEVGQFPQGASPAGAVDMIGNAWEWVADEIKVYPGNTESTLNVEPGITYRVIRGGAYDGGKTNDSSYRGYLDGSQAYPKVGFRCAKDAK